MNTSYIFLILFIVVVSFFIRIIFKSSEKKDEINAIAICVILALFCGLKSYSVGHDTMNYVNLFYRFGQTPMSELITTKGRFEIGYIVYTWLLYHISQSPTVYFIISYFLIFICFYKWINRNSSNICLSIVVLACLFLPFLLTGLRQAMALAIALLSYNALLDKKWVKCGIILTIAAMFHTTVLVMALFYCLLLLKKKWVRRVVVIVGSVVVFILRYQLFLVVNSIISTYEKFQINEGSIPFLYLTMLLAIYIFSEIFLNRQPMDDTSEREITIFSYSLLLIPFVTLNAAMMRMVMYASIYSSLLVPKIGNSINKKFNIRCANYIIGIVCVYILLHMVLHSNVYEYRFIWE